MRFVAALLLACPLLACSKPPPNAERVCAALVEDGIAKSCVREGAHGLGARATERMTFDLVRRPGHKGEILFFAKKDDYEEALLAFRMHFPSDTRYESTGRMYLIHLDAAGDSPEAPRMRVLLEGKGLN